jgi:flavin reductase (DIM6/NTAB) family NADH-FMN oxidoreductase RutF
MTVTTSQMTDAFRASMRAVAASVSLVTSCDENGGWHGMAVTSASSLSMDPPSMMVAINRAASIHPIIQKSGRYALNLMGEGHAALLEAFSRSDMRNRRFLPDQWQAGANGLPVLKGALSAHLCRVVAAHEFGTHTVFFGEVEDVVLPETPAQSLAPIIWLNGARMSVCAAAKA